MSDAALAAAGELTPLVGAVTYKGYRPEREFPEAVTFMDTPLNVIEADFPAGLERMGLWTLMRDRPVAGLGCDLGPAALDVEEAADATGYPRWRLRSPRLTRDQYVERARRNVAWLRRRFSGAVRLENLNYFPTPDDAYALVCEPEFIKDVVEATDAELLLDVAHARISAANFGVPMTAYLAGLPLQRASEVHLSACRVINGEWQDAHEPPGPEEWHVLSWLLERAPIRYVTIEYYRDPQVLVEAYRHLARLLADSGRDPFLHGAERPR